MSEMSDIFDLIAELARIETEADELRTIGLDARDGNGCPLHRSQNGVTLEIMSGTVDLESSARRGELEGYVSTLMPDTAEDAYALLVLANHISTNFDLAEECGLRRRFTRCLTNAIYFYEGALSAEAKARAECYRQPLQRWPELMADFEEASERFRRSAPVSITIKN